MGTTFAPDRRSYRRAPLDAPALVDAESSWQSARCRDVSLSGISVDSDQQLPEGTVVQVYFELPSGVAVETHAVVVRADGDVLGLRFVDLDEESRLAVRAHCRVGAMHQVATV